MERSPYDPSAEEAFHRNEKRLKEELEKFQSNCIQLEEHLKKWGIEEELAPPPSKKKEGKKILPRKNWLRI